MNRDTVGRLHVAWTSVAAALVATACAVGIASAATSAPTITTVMTALNSPRGLGFAPNGDLVVVEAGDAAAACTELNAIAIAPRRLPGCVSRTGSISVLPAGGSQRRDQTGWPSWRSNAPGQMFVEVTGPHDIGFPSPGRAFVSVGWGGTPAERSTAAAARGLAFGRLVQTGPGGKRRAAADPAGYEQAFNPASGPVDSNPYGVLAETSGIHLADAGANALLRIRGWNTSLVTTFPAQPRTCQTPFPAPPVQESVPTSVVRGPDRALYVGELTGFPFCAGSARIWKIGDDGRPVVHLSGFKMIIDLAFARDGTLYVLQYASAPFLPTGPGQIVAVSPAGARTTLDTGAALQAPSGIAIGSDGALYVSNKTVTPGGGEVLRIVL